MSDSAIPGLTLEQVRAMGDASADQRAELRTLLETKRYSKGWRDTLFADVLADRGLTAVRATAVLNWLRVQPNLDGSPVHATDDQAEAITELLRVRLTPGPFARLIRDQLTSRTMTHDQADLALKDLIRLPLREFPKPPPADGKIRTSNVRDGQYAVRGNDARVRFYKVTTDVVGAREVKHLNGPRRRRLVRNATELERILLLIAVDPAAAARLYGEEAKKCSACNRPLYKKDQPGYPHGYGPDCWAELVAEKKIRDHQATIPDED